MPARPIFHAEFGKYLADLRDKRNMSQSDAARFGRKLTPLLTRHVLLHMEAGKTKDPEPDVLRALAVLYEVPYEVIVEKLVACRYGITSRKNTTAETATDELESALPVEGQHGPSASPARLTDVQAAAQDRLLARAIRATRLTLLSLTALRGQTPVARVTEPRHRLGPRGGRR